MSATRQKRYRERKKISEVKDGVAADHLRLLCDDKPEIAEHLISGLENFCLDYSDEPVSCFESILALLLPVASDFRWYRDLEAKRNGKALRNKKA